MSESDTPNDSLLVVTLKLAEAASFDPRVKSTFYEAWKRITELERELARMQKELDCAQENFHVTNQAYVKADRALTQAQARIEELEKDAARLDYLEREMELEQERMRKPLQKAQLLSLFRRNSPITRATIDAALREPS